MKKEEFERVQAQKYMRAEQLAKYLGVGKSTIWLWNKQKKITAIKISSGVTVFNIDDVEKSLFGKGA